jgi:hypothetical protein
VLLGLLGNEVGVLPGTRAIPVVQPTAVRVGPGAKYTQYPAVALTFTDLQDYGYTPLSTRVKWEITQPYADGLNDGTAQVVDPATKRTGMVQHYIRSESYQSEAGSLWGITYGVAQFSDTWYADTFYATNDISFPGSDIPTNLTLEFDCVGKSLVGIDENRLTRINSIYKCNDTVLVVYILGAQTPAALNDFRRFEAGDMIAYINPKMWLFEQTIWHN